MLTIPCHAPGSIAYERPRLREARGGAIHAGHLVAALGEPDRVPALALGQAQHAPRPRRAVLRAAARIADTPQMVLVLAQEIVRLGAECPAGFGIASIPIGHVRPPSCERKASAASARCASARRCRTHVRLTLRRRCATFRDPCSRRARSSCPACPPCSSTSSGATSPR